jgi:hypothetical protein
MCCGSVSGREGGGRANLVQGFVFFGQLRNFFDKVVNFGKGSIFVVATQTHHKHRYSVRGGGEGDRRTGNQNKVYEQ